MINTGFEVFVGVPVDLITIYDSSQPTTNGVITKYMSNGKDLGSIFTLYSNLGTLGYNGSIGINCGYLLSDGSDIGNLFVRSGTMTMISSIVDVTYTGSPSILTRSYDGKVFIFNNNGSITFPSSSSYSVKIIAVGGGGGGGGYNEPHGMRGGGGAGGLVDTSLIITTSTTLTITIGNGGNGGWDEEDGSQGETTRGVFSNTYSSIIAGGGGGGGGRRPDNNGSTDGGSGGGCGTNQYADSGGLANTSNNNKAFNGGSTTHEWDGAGGGGGAGGLGGNGVSGGEIGGNGGIGYQSDITGTATYYAGGGGGGHPAEYPGTGGLGGGGNYNDEGTANTGGGGGGGGASGGSGVFIVYVYKKIKKILSSSWVITGGATIVSSPVNSPDTYSIFASGNISYGYLNVASVNSDFTSFYNCQIIVDLRAIDLVDFYFGCNSTGSGNMFRLEARNAAFNYKLGFAATGSWTNWNDPTTGSPSVTAYTWYTIIITINSSGVATYTYNGIAGTGSIQVNAANTYIGLQGDAGGGGGYLCNLSIRYL